VSEFPAAKIGDDEYHKPYRYLVKIGYQIPGTEVEESDVREFEQSRVAVRAVGEPNSHESTGHVFVF